MVVVPSTYPLHEVFFVSFYVCMRMCAVDNPDLGAPGLAGCAVCKCLALSALSSHMACWVFGAFSFGFALLVVVWWGSGQFGARAGCLLVGVLSRASFALSLLLG